MRRWLATVAFALLIGAIINVAVAWGCANWCDTRDLPRVAGYLKLEDPTIWSLASYRSRCGLRLHSVWGAMPGLDLQPPPLDRLIPAAAWLDPRRDDPPMQTGSRVFDARGWPLLSMWSGLELEASLEQVGAPGVLLVMSGEPAAIISGIRLADTGAPVGGAPQHRFRVLPLGVLPLGFAANTVLYGGMCLALLVVWRSSRRIVRLGAGRCGACAYDLSRATGGPCPECGRPASALIGTPMARKLRWAVIAAWSLVALAALGAGGRWGWRAFDRHDWSWAKPMWWLRIDTGSDDAFRSARALDEIVGRISDGRLDGREIGALVERAMALQADTARPWVAPWGDLVAAARDLEHVDDETWRRFAEQAIVPELRVRARVLEGDALVGFVLLHKRSMSEERLVYQVSRAATTVGTQSVSAAWDRTSAPLRSPPVGGQMTWPSYNALELTGGDPLILNGTGTQEMVSTFELTVADGMIDFRGSLTGEVLVQKTVTLRATIDVVPAGAETVEVVEDDSLTQAVRDSLSLTSISGRVMSYGMTREGGRLVAVSGRVGVSSPPIDLAFDVFLRAGEREWLVGRIYSETLFPRDGGSFEGRADGLDSKAVDVVLRSSTAAARRSLSITRIWGGEIVLEDVRVVWEQK